MTNAIGVRQAAAGAVARFLAASARDAGLRAQRAAEECAALVQLSNHGADDAAEALRAAARSLRAASEAERTDDPQRELESLRLAWAAADTAIEAADRTRQAIVEEMIRQSAVPAL